MLIIYAIFYHLLDYYTVKFVNMQAEKGEKRAEVQKMRLNRRKKKLKPTQGSLEMILLSLIGRKETYGYEIITELNSSASVLGYAKEGTIYPILYRLQEAELIQCRLAPAAANGGSKKYYSLTLKGKEVLQELITFWSSYTDCVNSFIATYQQTEVSE